MPHCGLFDRLVPTLTNAHAIALLASLSVLPASASVLCQSQPPIQLACSKADSALLKQKYGKYFVDTVDSLRIVATNGKELVLARNKDESPAVAEPGVIASIEPFNLLLVIVAQWEGYELHLVNYKHGAHFKVDGWPLVSPDNKRMLIHSEAVESNYHPNQLSIYKVTGGYLRLEYFVDGDSASTYSWGPIDPSWTDARTVHFLKKWYGDTGEMRQRVTLRLDRDGWSNSGKANKPFHATPNGARESQR